MRAAGAGISEPQARRARLRWSVARGHDADDDLLPLLDIPLGHLGVGAIADAELKHDRGRLAVGPDHPDAPGGRATPAAAPAARPGGPLALGSLDSGRPEPERRVR